jgi:hypothetical protein
MEIGVSCISEMQLTNYQSIQRFNIKEKLNIQKSTAVVDLNAAKLLACTKNSSPNLISKDNDKQKVYYLSYLYNWTHSLVSQVYSYLSNIVVAKGG